MTAKISRPVSIDQAGIESFDAAHGLDNLSVREAAELLGVTRQRVEQFQKAGRLVPYRRKPALFSRRAVERFARIVRKPGKPPQRKEKAK
jgi:hypothetical protein